MRIGEKIVLKGETESGTNAAVVAYLQSLNRRLDNARFLDVGCGQGALLRVLRQLFPASTIVGADINAASCQAPETFVHLNAAKPFPAELNREFDVITCISATGEFDDLRGFIESCVARLSVHGILIVAGENYYDVRDRLSFLFFGRLRKHRLLTPRQGRNTATSKIVMLGELSQLFADNGLILEVRYSPLSNVDLLLFPVAIMLYVPSLLYLLLARSDVPLVDRMKMYPFAALLSRSQLAIGLKP